MNILVTGGAGYIGSHAALELLNLGYGVIIADNLVNSKREAVLRIEKISGKEIKFYQADLTDSAAVKRIFEENNISACMHFAGLKAVGESCEKPLEYYYNNIAGTAVLLKTMKEANVKNVIFSSSATVYGAPDKMPIGEDFPLKALNPYGRTKLFIEDMLRDLYSSDKDWNIGILRYFNPLGAHESGLIGEDPCGIPNNLAPYILKVITGKLPHVKVMGNDYNTPDGTGVRDYIHISDLIRGHILALEKLLTGCGMLTLNLGTGNGYSVLEVISAYEKAWGKKIPYIFEARRPGDSAICFSDPGLAEREIGFKAKHSLFEMCKDSLNWQLKNPEGYNKQ